MNAADLLTFRPDTQLNAIFTQKNGICLNLVIVGICVEEH